MIDGDTMIDGRTGEVLAPEVDLEKQILRADFIVFVDHKFTCRKLEGLHILNSTDILDT